MYNLRTSIISKYLTRFWVTAILGLFILVGFGCGKNQPEPKPFEQLESQIQRDEINTNAKFNEQLFASANLSPDRGDYLLGPGDLLEIKVFESEKLNTTVRVSSRGLISLPLLEEINVKGLTADDAEKLIEEKYRSTYIKNPHVSIFVQEHFSQRVTIVGEVKNPGTYDFPSRQRLLDAIALAGGLTENAGKTARIRRINQGLQGPGSEFLVDLDELMNEGRTDLNISINGGDVIFVPEAGAIFIDGAVRRPGRYQINKSMTLMEAILTAGGFEYYAALDNVTLSRETETGGRETFLLDFSKNAEALIATQQLQLRDRDIILVERSFWGKLRGLGLNIGTNGVGVLIHDPGY